jgi:hypothetical protein
MVLIACSPLSIPFQQMHVRKWLQRPEVKHLGTYYRYWKPEKLSKAEVFSYTWYFPVLLLLWIAALLSLLVTTCWKLVCWNI